MTGINWLLCCLTFCNVVGFGSSTFQFASYYNDHMVLQQGAGGAIVWGTSSNLSDTVQLVLNGHKVSEDVVTHSSTGIMTWIAKVVVIGDNYGPYTLAAKSGQGTRTLHDVMFGDVWICSGQSNMEFNMYGVTNHSAEFAEASNYSNVRIFKTKHTQSSVALHDFNDTPFLNWSVPVQATLGGFSAVCWLFGKQLSSQFKYPIGLIESNWGGTRIEWWSLASALSKCPHNGKRAIHNSDLWNAMMSPFTRNTIYGAFWYQGKAGCNLVDIS
ncbi:sialate O-acetylesterase-like [Mizuhopecten yessoensis]|uniref:sialate O-acetylesterase-like n=1 Tax=Mizuhopecten yessoensis TaxID=6573 RepID=UPI000B45B5FE|nr:sialate O-acetylesterase-like [Mizuhopecten yessoensis]